MRMEEEYNSIISLVIIMNASIYRLCRLSDSLWLSCTQSQASRPVGHWRLLCIRTRVTGDTTKASPELRQPNACGCCQKTPDDTSNPRCGQISVI